MVDAGCTAPPVEVVEEWMDAQVHTLDVVVDVFSVKCYWTVYVITQVMRGYFVFLDSQFGVIRRLN